MKIRVRKPEEKYKKVKPGAILKYWQDEDVTTTGNDGINYGVLAYIEGLVGKPDHYVIVAMNNTMDQTPGETAICGSLPNEENMKSESAILAWLEVLMDHVEYIDNPVLEV